MINKNTYFETNKCVTYNLGHSWKITSWNEQNLSLVVTFGPHPFFQILYLDIKLSVQLIYRKP